MKILRYILFPIVPIYYLVTWLRNKFYDIKIFKSSEFNVASICVGNLSVGGTGKSPMIEYLIRLFSEEYFVATLSRGYKRSTDGFIIADENDSAATIGDEPYQFYRKFDNIIVSVDTDRRHAISELLKLPKPPQLILLDDAFQHRKVKATSSILLTAYDELYVDDIPLPTGDLREPKSGAKRADVIVVTKCPPSILKSQKERIETLLKPQIYQKVFFSSINYSDVIISSVEERPLEFLFQRKVALVTGIANPKPLIEHLKSKKLKFEHLNFDDHHQFSHKEIDQLKSKEFILTTEKDFMRLSPFFPGNNNIFYLPIELKIDREEEFQNIIRSKIIPME